MRAHQPLGGGIAAVVGFALGIPVLAHLIRQSGIEGGVFQVIDQQGIAAHLAVVVHPVVRVFSGEARPVAALAEQQQPVVTQPVFLVAAGIARHEILHLLGTGFAQSGPQFPVSRPGLQRMPPDLGEQLCQPAFVAGPKGFAHVDDQAIACRIDVRRHGGGRALRQARRGQQARQYRAENNFV